MTPPLDTAALRKLLEAATPGPWHLYAKHKLVICKEDDFSIGQMSAGYPQAPLKEQEANAALIVAMRNALPALLDRLKELERDAARWRFVVSARNRTDIELASIDPTQPDEDFIAAIDAAMAEERKE